MVGKIIRLVVGVATMHLLLATGVARAQSPSPSARRGEGADPEHASGRAVQGCSPSTFQENEMKAAIVEGRAEVERQYDALVPVMTEAFQARVSEMSEAAVIVYATHVSADDLQALNAFYKTPTGQRLLQKMPAVSLELVAVGAEFGQSVGRDVQQRMIEELRKKGVNL